MNPGVLHNPRPYLFEDEASIIHLGEIDYDGLAGHTAHSDITERLDRERLAEYRQARREGFHPVLLIDLETGVGALEMRKAL